MRFTLNEECEIAFASKIVYGLSFSLAHPENKKVILQNIVQNT